MENQILIRHQEGDIRRDVRSAELLFRREADTWRLDLASRTFEAADPNDAAEAAGLIQIHLVDYPLGTEDPREKDHLDLSIPEGFDSDTMSVYTNLYLGEHFPTDENQI